MHKPWRTIPAVALIALLFSGCDSIGDDLSGLGDVFKPTTPSEAARMAVDPTDPDNRRQGITLLSNASFGGVEAYVNLYRDSVDNERDPIVKAVAIQALGKHGQPEDAVRIVPHLAHANEQVRWAAAKSLQRLHNPVVVPDLLRVLGNETEHKDVRIAAAQALAQYPEDRVFHGLVAALNARELAINSAAEQSLHTLTGQVFNLSAPDWLAWYERASLEGTAFAAQGEYLYPVYSRETKWWEKAAFWSPKTFEQPAPPAGLRQEGERRTYEAEAEPAPAPGVLGSPSAAESTTQRSTYGDD